MASRAIALILACAASAATLEARAIGFGRPTASAVLGQRLDLPIPFHLAPNEHIGPECVSAEVTAGETRLGRDHVRVRIEPAPGGTAAGTDWLARVTSDTAIHEPVLEILLNVGCERQFSRRFVAFADPPLAAATPPETLPPSVTAAARAPAAAGEEGRASRAAPAAGKPRQARTAAERNAEPAPTKRRRTARGVAPSAGAAVAPAPAPAPATAGAGARLLLDAVGPRLKLDIEDPVPSGSGASAVAPGVAVAEPLPEAVRLQQLEKTLADQRREARREREATAALKARLAEAELGHRAVPWLASLLVITLLVAAWLALRLRRQQEETARVPQWWASEPAAEAAPTIEPIEHEAAVPAWSDETGAVVDTPPTAPLAATWALERDLAPPPPPAVEPVHERTAVMPGPAPRTSLSASANPSPAEHQVTVEELLDLEQQADFFIALGQEDAAIDLLMSHLRSTGGLSPLPYTNLLEIWRRKGDREAYERIRTRFNRRFNAYAPEWEAGPLSGRALEDYADVVQQLQALWAEPLDAMAVLEAMLFRKDTTQELFDLPAYKDVLLLYAVARDLWQGAGRRPAIDVLLPLGGQPASGEAETAAP